MIMMMKVLFFYYSIKRKHRCVIALLLKFAHA